MPEQKLRLGLQDAIGLRSRYWAVIVRNERDVYLAHETLTPAMKVSLHESGRFHVATLPGEDHWGWEVPDAQHPGFVHVFTLGLLPGSAVTSPVKVPAALYEPAPPGHIRYFKFIYEHWNARMDTWPGKTADQSELVGRLSIVGGVRLCIVTTVDPFESVTQYVPGDAPGLAEQVGRTEPGLMGILFGANPDGSRWMIEGPVTIGRQ